MTAGLPIRPTPPHVDLAQPVQLYSAKKTALFQKNLQEH